MARSKKKYANGQSRGDGTGDRKPRAPKDYHRQKVAYHGGELALEAFEEGLKNKK